MSVRVKRFSSNADVQRSPEYIDSTPEQNEVFVDGQAFFFGPNETKNFADDGVGAAVAGFAPGSNIVEEKITSGTGKA